MSQVEGEAMQRYRVLIDKFKTLGLEYSDLAFDPINLATEIACAAFQIADDAPHAIALIEEMLPPNNKDDHATRGVAIGIILMLFTSRHFTTSLIVGEAGMVCGPCAN